MRSQKVRICQQKTKKKVACFRPGMFQGRPLRTSDLDLKDSGEGQS